ncbi:MAG: DNA polymerase III subunit delta' [Pseudomonadota bacterium]
MIYAWHEPAWAQLRAGRVNQHHALLLHGPVGTGKRRFANLFAQALLCVNSKETGLPCDKCADCHWFSQGTHPDFRLLTPDALRLEAEAASEGATEESTRGEKKAAVQITIDQVRELQNFVSLTTHRNGGKRVVLIHPAEAMNIFAGNALLKMLEEPSAETVFLLITDDTRRLLPTIISRCRRFPLPGVARAEALAWLRQQGIPEAEVLLAQAGGAPLAALAMAETGETEERRRFLDQLARLSAPDTALELAALSQKTALFTVVRWLSTWCYDLMAIRLTGTIRYHLDYSEAIKTLAQRLSLDQLLIYQDLLKAAARSYTHPLNPRLFLEQLLLSYCQTIAGKPNQ